MANNNINLQNAKDLRDDEFYTTYESIEEELAHYSSHFLGKKILCNCDDPFESNFCKYFSAKDIIYMISLVSNKNWTR